MKIRLARAAVRIAVAGSIIALIACGNHETSSPSAPSQAASPPSTVPPVTTQGATISGTVVGASSASSAGWSTRGAGISVTVSGSTSATTVDGNNRFVLQNVPPGHVDLHFMGNGIDAHLTLDGVVDKQTLVITVRLNGTGATLENNGNNNQPPDQNNEIEFEGSVTSIGTNSLVVAGRTVTVTASTQITSRGSTVALSAIHVGDTVEVHATQAAAGGALTATRINVEDRAPGDNDDNDDDRNEAELNGTVTNLAGSCAANNLSFSVNATMVRTSAATQFKDTTCGALAAGTSVEVKGTRQADASVLASRIERKK